MPKIFISYRRADSQYVTDSIYDYMVRYFGRDNVFLDVGSVDFGVDFRTYLFDQVQAHDAVLVIIGPEWARMLKERSNQPNDFVRIEIENALKLGKLVIPVLVMNAEMPSFVGLPESIQELQWHNFAMVRRQPDLEHDCARLADSIKHYFATNTKPTSLPDPTAQVKSRFQLPVPFAWVDIPAGQVTLSEGWDSDAYSVGQTFDVPMFTIARHPITNAQFAKFIDAGGYENRQWWTDAGWEAREKGYDWDASSSSWKSTGKAWTQPRFWGDSKWNGEQQPVVGVSWYESVAFCLWLSETSGEETILPTEQQWQRAAQGDDGRAYPWGNEWDCERCSNSVEPCKDDRTTPVTLYEGEDKGDSPYGVVDMSGNVWEWCLTGYETGSNNIDINTPRVVRGGSWFNHFAVLFSVDIRYWDFPPYGYCWLGFRIARAS